MRARSLDKPCLPSFSPPMIRYGLSLALVAGCAAPRRTFQPPHDPATLDDTAFVHYLATVPVASVDEGLRAVLMLTGPTSQWPTFEERRAELLRLGALRPEWELEANQILDKGTLAYMLRVLCRLPHGLSEVLAKATHLGSRRYALKTCIDEGMLPYATAEEPVTGAELLGALTKAEARSGSSAADES